MMPSWCCIFSMTLPERLYIREPSTMTGMLSGMVPVLSLPALPPSSSSVHGSFFLQRSRFNLKKRVGFSLLRFRSRQGWSICFDGCI
jgi:hypothetical protein